MIRRSTALQLLGGGFVASSLVTVAPARAQATKIRAVGVPLDVGAAVYYAVDQGIFARHGLDVEILTVANGAAGAAAVAGGSMEVGDGNTVAIATAHERGLPFQIIAPAGAFSRRDPTDGMVVAKDSPIKTAKDLNGKIIGVNGLRNIGEITGRTWMDKHGGDSSTAKFVELTFADAGPSLVAGRVDAVSVEEPVLSAVLALGGRQIGIPGEAVAPVFVEGAYFCTSQYVQEHPAVVKQFAAAIFEANAWANRNAAAASAVLAKFQKTTTHATHRCYYPERLDAALIQPLIDATAKYGVLKSTFRAKDLLAAGVA